MQWKCADHVMPQATPVVLAGDEAPKNTECGHIVALVDEFSGVMKGKYRPSVGGKPLPGGVKMPPRQDVVLTYSIIGEEKIGRLGLARS